MKQFVISMIMDLCCNRCEGPINDIFRDTSINAIRYAGEDFQAELAAAVKRKQESLHILPRCADQPDAFKPSGIPSLHAIQQMSAGLRKIKPPPPKPASPPFPAQLSPDWGNSPAQLELAAPTQPKAAPATGPVISVDAGRSAMATATAQAPTHQPDTSPSPMQSNHEPVATETAPTAAAQQSVSPSIPASTPVATEPVPFTTASTASAAVPARSAFASKSAHLTTPVSSGIMFPPMAMSTVASSRGPRQDESVTPPAPHARAAQGIDALRAELLQAQGRIAHLELVIAELQKLVPEANHPDLLQYPTAFVASLQARRMGAGMGKGLMLSQVTPPAAMTTDMTTEPATGNTACSISFGMGDQASLTTGIAPQVCTLAHLHQTHHLHRRKVSCFPSCRFAF
jgi:hypothetical protein